MQVVIYDLLYYELVYYYLLLKPLTLSTDSDKLSTKPQHFGVGRKYLSHNFVARLTPDFRYRVFD